MSYSRGQWPRKPSRPSAANLPPRPNADMSSDRPQGGRDMYQFGARSRPRNDFTFRSRISQRDLLTHVPSSIETPVLSQNHAGNKFRDVENLTDSEEEEMSEDDVVEDESRSKRRKIAKDDASAEAQVKWSNPDPYTALPPAPDSSHKRVDVVKLIRKARHDPGGHDATDANQADFISFDNLDGDDPFAPPSNAPAGPKANPFAHDGASESISNKVLGKRKHDALDNDALIGSIGRTRFHKSGRVLAAWESVEESSATPWLKVCNSHESPMTALHKEIIDFYEWVKPKDFEAALRLDLLNRLAAELARWRPGGRLQAFGSYAAGLYLPTGDMDLVYNYSGSLRPAKRDVYDVATFLQNRNFARPGTIQPIGKAKVPIVKFVDNLTGLKVDLSFNNNTGIVANETFKKWQATYPAVTIIVSVIKQFLMIRGLNDNASGGLGGFATICMVTSLVQNLPQESQNLGELLIEFFNLYGNLLNVQDVGIRLEPPGYINKRTHRLMSNERPDRLVIIDPNQADNNITGGGSEYLRIAGLFSKMYTQLTSRLDEFTHRGQDNDNFSFLTEVIGGNFAAYTAQRTALFKIHNPGQKMPQDEPETARTDRNGTVMEASASIPDPPFSSQANSSKGESRLARLRTLCPELVDKMANLMSIGPNQAMLLGGWKTKNEMSQALNERENAIREAARQEEKRVKAERHARLQEQQKKRAKTNKAKKKAT